MLKWRNQFLIHLPLFIAEADRIVEGTVTFPFPKLGQAAAARGRNNADFKGL